MSNNPQHSCLIELVESIASINKQKFPFFGSMVDNPGMLHEVNTTFKQYQQTTSQHRADKHHMLQ